MPKAGSKKRGIGDKKSSIFFVHLCLGELGCCALHTGRAVHVRDHLILSVQCLLLIVLLPETFHVSSPKGESIPRDLDDLYKPIHKKRKGVTVITTPWHLFCWSKSRQTQFISVGLHQCSLTSPDPTSLSEKTLDRAGKAKILWNDFILVAEQLNI